MRQPLKNKVIGLDRQPGDFTKDLARPVVFTNGCFDLLHRGHVDYLEQAAQLGKTLVVGVNSDESVVRLKGPQRPINSLEDRMAILAALAVVDLVIAFAEDTPEKLISKIRPEFLVKGGDWPVDQIVGAKYVQSYGGKVQSIAFRFDRSTTNLINQVKSFA